MGKFERGLVREAELILTKMLNRRSLSDEERRHRLFRCVSVLERRIRQDYPDIVKARHVGDTYTSPGDIELFLGNGRRAYIEVKFVAGGRGTRANIGQDSLTELELFEDAISWSRFREQKGHDEWVMRALDRFRDYPSKCLIGARRRVLIKKAKYLKDEILCVRQGQNTRTIAERISRNPEEAPKRRLAAQIVLEIMDRDRREKLEYIAYLRTRRQNPDNIKKFAFLILIGAHLRRAIREMWRLTLDQIVDMIRGGSYRVYYCDKRTLRVYVEDLTEKLEKLMEKELYIAFREGETNVIIAFKDEAGIERPVLRVVFHWKNVFQGIQTPCLNVFDGAWLAEDP